MTLETKGLSVLYETVTGAGRHVVRALMPTDVTVTPGRVTGVLGESGSGKSTLALALTGLLPPDARVSGEVCLDGTALIFSDDAAMSRIRGKRVALLQQNVSAAFHPLYTVGEQVAETLVIHEGMTKGEALDRARTLLDRFGLPADAAERRASALSGGQRQRAAWAMMLAANPDYLILDEPTAGQDPATRRFLLGEVRRLRDAGCGILFITHDLGALRRLADETVVMYFGEVVERMTGSPLDGRPRHPATRGLVRSWPDAGTLRELAGIKGRAPTGFVHVHDGETGEHRHDDGRHAPDRGCRFAPRCPQATPDCRLCRPTLDAVPGGAVRCLRGGIVTRLELHGIRHRYDRVEALTDVTLSVDAGETLVVLGESGSGKSTLAHVAAGLMTPDAGLAVYEGCSADSRFLRERVGFVEQEPALHISPRMTILDIVAEPLRLRFRSMSDNAVRTKVTGVLHLVHLPHDEAFLSRTRESLNAGALQRLAIARALVTDPQLLVLDEPTSALDPSVQAKLLRHLLDLQTEQGLSLILITHDVGVAGKTADRLAVLHVGELVETGPARRLFHRPTSEALRRLLAASTGDDDENERWETS